MKKRNKHKILLIYVLSLLALFFVFSIIYLSNKNIALLNPSGPVALKEYHLLMFSLVLSLTVVVPVFALTIIFAIKYREGNKHHKYSPNLDGNKFAETIWWIMPSLLIIILGVVTWNSSHDLDPYKSLTSSNRAITIQVVAMNWKWLFIYPKQNIATVNYFVIPNQTPINFEITSDAPMNSFWIPRLGGQIYAMPGMSTQLNLLASRSGIYNGSSANISGLGFAGMTFNTRSTNMSDFDIWITSIKNTNNVLDSPAYNSLAIPSQYNKVTYYSSTEPNLYDNIIYKYNYPGYGYGADPQAKTIPNIQQLHNIGMQGMGM